MLVGGLLEVLRHRQVHPGRISRREERNRARGEVVRVGAGPRQTELVEALEVDRVDLERGPARASHRDGCGRRRGRGQPDDERQIPVRARVSSDDPICLPTLRAAFPAAFLISRASRRGLDDRDLPMDGPPRIAAGSVEQGVSAQGRACQRFWSATAVRLGDPRLLAAPRYRELRTRGAETTRATAPHDLDRVAGRLARLRRAFGSHAARRCARRCTGAAGRVAKAPAPPTRRCS